MSEFRALAFVAVSRHSEECKRNVCSVVLEGVDRVDRVYGSSGIGAEMRDNVSTSQETRPASLTDIPSRTISQYNTFPSLLGSVRARMRLPQTASTVEPALECQQNPVLTLKLSRVRTLDTNRSVLLRVRTKHSSDQKFDALVWATRETA